MRENDEQWLQLTSYLGLLPRLEGGRPGYEVKLQYGAAQQKKEQ